MTNIVQMRSVECCGVLCLLTLILPGFHNYVKGQGGGRFALPIVNRPKLMQNPFFSLRFGIFWQI